MADIALLWKTLDYGRESSTNASWITLIIILFFTASIFLLLKVQWWVATSKKMRMKTSKNDPTRNVKGFLKALPMIVLIFIIIFFGQWFVKLNLIFERNNWQADFFIAFMFAFFLFLLLGFYEMILQLRRTLTWFVVNGTFKLISMILFGMALTPYYILSVSYKQSIWRGDIQCYGFWIFLAYTLICFYAFRASPLTTLVPMIVLWGGAFSYYKGWYAVSHGIFGNGSGIIVFVASIFGISVTKAIGKHQKVASPEFMAFYCIFLFIVIAGFWVAMWQYYDYPMFGTDFENFHSSSFYPDPVVTG